MSRQTILFMTLLLLLAGCAGGPEMGKPTQSPERNTDQPAADTADSSAADATSPSSSPTQQDEVLGDILKDQSFQVEFENFGAAEFISTEEMMDGIAKVRFYIKQGLTVTQLKYEPASPDSYYSVSAVSFRDVSGDGKKDILVIADYVTGFGYMGTIPVSQLLIFKQTDSGFIEDPTLEDRATTGVPYRILSVQDVLTGLETKPEDSVSEAWRRFSPGTYTLIDTGSYSASVLTLTESSGSGLLFSLDAFYAANKNAYDQGNVNMGSIESGRAKPEGSEMIFRDGDFTLSFGMISNGELYLRENGEGYFGFNVNVNGVYVRK